MRKFQDPTKKAIRGQTILELAFFMTWFLGFFLLITYLFEVFDISQKQTMLVRNQAFMELGNYSDFSRAKHGEDNPKNQASRVGFSLGKKSSGTRVDLDKIESFKKATAGNLTVDVVHSKNQDYYWETFRFPKQKTKLAWFEGNTTKKNIEIDLQQNLAIAHNRSINSASSFLSLGQAETGLFSGSIGLNDFAKLADLASKVMKQSGLVDNLELLREAGRKLVKDDPSLANEAAALEKSLNAADGLSGGAQAAMISAVVSTAASFLSQAAGSSLSKGGGAAKAGAGASGGAGAGAGAKAGSGLLAQVANPVTDAQNFFKGTLLEAPMSAAFAPVTSVTQGLASFTSGLSSGSILNSGGALSGLSQMGQGVSMGASFAGVSIQELNMASTLAGFPGALDSGISGFFGSLNNVNPSGVGDYVGAFTRMVKPVTELVSMFAPDTALPMGYVNAGLSLANGLASTYDAVGKFASPGFAGEKFSDVLKDVGAFTVGVGGLYSTVAGLAGKDPTPGAYMAMAGGGLMATGMAIDMAEQLKKEGVHLSNPFEVGKALVKKNIDGAEKSWTKFEKDMSTASNTIGASMTSIFTKGRKIDDPLAKDTVNGVADLTKKSYSGYDNMVNGVNKDDLGKANILRAGKDLNEMEAALVLNMKYHGVDDSKVGDVKADFKEVKDTIATLEKFKAGEISSLDPELLARGNAAVSRLNITVGDYLSQNPSVRKADEFGVYNFDYSDQQVKAMLAHDPNSQKTVELEAVANNETFQSQKLMEEDLRSQGGLKGVWFGVKSITGSNRTLKADRDQRQKAMDLVTLANVKNAAEKKIDSAKVAVNATQISEKISMFGPIASNDPTAVRESAAKLASIIESSRYDPIYSDTMRARMGIQLEKLNAIAKGEREIISERQWLIDAKNQVNQSVKEMKENEKRIAENIANGCSADGC